MQFNSSEQEIVLKVVYCGPPGSGKTTNLTQVHRLLDPHCCGRFDTLNAGPDKTLHFDIAPPARGGYRIKLRLFAAVGQVTQASTHRVAMAGVDGIVFVADTQAGHEESNVQHWEQMLQIARVTGADMASLPIVVQFNKRDLHDACDEAALESMRSAREEPTFIASAVRGEGVLETLHGLLEGLFELLDDRYNFQTKFNLSSEDFLDEVFANPMRR